MDISGSSALGVSGTLEIKSAQLAKSMQQQNGQAALELIEAADVTRSSSTPNLGSTINTYA